MRTPEERRKLLKYLSGRAPKTYEALFGRKYHLPKARQGEYVDLEFDLWMGFERLYRFAKGGWDMSDEVSHCALTCLCANLRYGCPTLYLERELGEALLRTEILPDLNTADVNWPWPAFRVVLPKHLLAIEREGLGVLYLTHFEIAQASIDSPVRCPLEIAKEIDGMAAKDGEVPEWAHLLEKAFFAYKDKQPGISVSAALDQPDSPTVHQTIYGMMKPWGKVTVGELTAMDYELTGLMRRDLSDGELLHRLEALAINVLLFLSAVPSTYQPSPRVVRKPSIRHLQPGLVEARFVGGLASRPELIAPARSDSTGRTVAAHWVRGAWRRVAYGPKSSLRRLSWIKPYATGVLRDGSEAPETRGAGRAV